MSEMNTWQEDPNGGLSLDSYYYDDDDWDDYDYYGPDDDEPEATRFDIIKHNLDNLWWRFKVRYGLTRRCDDDYDLEEMYPLEFDE